MNLCGLLSLTLIALSSAVLVRMFRAKGISEICLLFFLFSSVQIVFQGFFVSLLKKINVIEYWFVLSFITLCIVLIIYKLFNRKIKLSFVDKNTFTDMRYTARLAVADIKNTEPGLLSIMFFTVIACGLLNLALVLFTAPFGHDSLSHWIGRIGYFLQHGSFDYFEANQLWIMHRPKLQTILMIFSYLVSGNNENLFQIVNYAAYWVGGIAVYYLCLVLSLDRTKSFFAGLIFLLLINPLMVSTTTQNDLLLPVYIAIFTCFIFSFKNTQQIKYIIVAALSLAMAFNVKETFIVSVPAIALITFYILGNQRKLALKFLIYLALFTALLALPSGYWSNLVQQGRFIVVPQEQLSSNYSLGSPFAYLKESFLNGLRFCVDFINLDGLPAQNQYIHSVQHFLKSIPETMLKKLHLDLATHYALNHGGYMKVRMPSADAILSYWGILGFLLVWPVVIWYILKSFLKRADVNRDFLMLGITTVVFFISQCMLGEYDVWRGRYFTLAAIFAVPLATTIFGLRNRLGRIFFKIVIILGCISAIFAVLFRDNSEIVPYRGKSSIFFRDRYEQLTRDEGGGVIADSYRKLDKILPENVTLTQWVGSEPLEYLYFGPHLSRRVIPLIFWKDSKMQVLYNADYMIYDSDSVSPELGDTPLGGKKFLRKLYPPMRYEENLALSNNEGKAFVRGGHVRKSTVRNLNDGTDKVSSISGKTDSVFAVVRKQPFYARSIQLILYNPDGVGSLRDVSVVATNNPRLPLKKWEILKSRIYPSGKFGVKTTIPSGYDQQAIMLDIDKDYPRYRAYRAFGIACFSGTKQYTRNYAKDNDEIALREMLASDKGPDYFEQQLKDWNKYSFKSKRPYVLDFWYYQKDLDVQKSKVKYSFENNIPALLIKASDNLALKENGGFAGATSNESGFSVSGLNDGTYRAWGNAGKWDGDDTTFFIAHKEDFLPHKIQLVLFSPQGNAHLREVSVVATDDPAKPLNEWDIIRSRVLPAHGFTEKITIPSENDESVVNIEIDQNSPNYRPHKIFGLACFSKSSGYARNYISYGKGVYVREILMSK